MRFISIIALLAPAILAVRQVSEAKPTDWISLLQEQCPDMPAKCLDTAKDVHQTDTKGRPNIFKHIQALETCNPSYQKCTQVIQNYIDNDSANVSTSKRAIAARENVVTCLLQILPDHFKYTAHPALAKTPFPAGSSCPLRDLHRVAHIALAIGGNA